MLNRPSQPPPKTTPTSSIIPPSTSSPPPLSLVTNHITADPEPPRTITSCLPYVFSSKTVCLPTTLTQIAKRTAAPEPITAREEQGTVYLPLPGPEPTTLITATRVERAVDKVTVYEPLPVNTAVED